jgi:hypothetical protein
MKITKRKYPANGSKLSANRYWGVMLYREYDGTGDRWTFDVYLGKRVHVWFWNAN